MHRLSGVSRLTYYVTNQLQAATSSVPRPPFLSTAVRAARASSSSSSPPLTGSSASPLQNSKGATTRDVHQAVKTPSILSQLTDRGVYDERTVSCATGYGVKSLAVVESGEHVQITWEDGKVSRYHSLWLRHTCFCPECRFEGNGQLKMPNDQIPMELLISSAVDDGEGCLVVKWEGEDHHTGLFPFKYLKYHCYSPESLKELREHIQMRFTTDTTLPEVTYEEVMESDKGLYRWMSTLNERGICLVRGIPAEYGMGKKVCERISGNVMSSVLFGYIDDLKSTPPGEEIIDCGYNTEELKLHQDLVYYSSPPGLQVLFCYQFNPEIPGGDSVFADMFHVAEAFREQYPEDFHVLATVPATFETIHYNRDWPVHLTVKRPMFTLNDHGDLTGVRYQPHRLGPLQVSEDMIKPFYAAYRKFYIMINNWPYKYSYRLQPGDMVSCNNRRFAHGRASFVLEGSQVRHMQGGYVNVSELKSCMQTLSNMIGDGRVIKRMGDYDFM